MESLANKEDSKMLEDGMFFTYIFFVLHLFLGDVDALEETFRNKRTAFYVGIEQGRESLNNRLGQLMAVAFEKIHRARAAHDNRNMGIVGKLEPALLRVKVVENKLTELLQLQNP